jgi:hypothetical protein
MLFGDRVTSSLLTVLSTPISLLEEDQPIMPVLDLATRLEVTLVD